MTPPFSLAGLDHIVLRVSDLAVSDRFYRDTLGCTLERSLPEVGLYQYRAGDQLIDLVVVGSRLGGEAAVVPAGNMDHFCLIVDPFDEASLREHLTGAGLSPSSTGTRYGASGYGPSLYITDPDGHIVELKGPGGLPSPPD